MSGAASSLSYRLDDYAYEFSPELVADAPAEPRDSSRLLVLDRRGGPLLHRAFRDLPHFLRSGDCLVVNRSKVLPARIVGSKPTGGKAELLLISEREPGLWSALSSDLKLGVEVLLPEGARARAESSAGGEWLVRFTVPGVRALLERSGAAPLPPYIRKRRKEASGPGDRPEDRDRYQTVYAREEGSIAAPTAGLHFTPELLERLRAGGVRVAEIILHVGLGTFRPVSAQDLREHRMLPERFELPPQSVETLARTRLQGGRFIPVGTTVVRTLETYARASGVHAGESALFVTPGHEFRMADALVTNFHQPRSTPLLLACAFAGRERLLDAYRAAVAARYRLFSFGDAMLIL